MNKVELMKTANEVRKGIIEAVHSAKSGHYQQQIFTHICILKK